jgi:hypothetical protein
VCGWRLSAEEIQRISGAMHFLERMGLPCLYVVLGDSLLNLPEPDARDIITEFKTRVVREQGRAGLPQYWLCVLESTEGIHPNLVFPATETMERSLRSSHAFGPYLRGADAIQSVYDFEGLVRFYLTKERPPNVRGGSLLGPRKKGSHRLGDGGGDRVQLSRALRRDALAVGLVQPWQRTTSKTLTERR